MLDLFSQKRVLQNCALFVIGMQLRYTLLIKAEFDGLWASAYVLIRYLEYV